MILLKNVMWIEERENTISQTIHIDGLLRRSNTLRIFTITINFLEGHVLDRRIYFLDKTELPTDMIQTLIKSRNANAGVFNLRQVEFLYQNLFRHIC